MTRIYDFTYYRLPLEDLVLIRGCRATSTSAPSSSEEVSSEEELSEDSSSQEKSDKSENSSPLTNKTILTLNTNYSCTWFLRPEASPWLISADMLIVLYYNKGIFPDWIQISVTFPLKSTPLTTQAYVNSEKGKTPFLGRSRRLRCQERRRHGADVHARLKKQRPMGYNQNWDLVSWHSKRRFWI